MFRLFEIEDAAAVSDVLPQKLPSCFQTILRDEVSVGITKNRSILLQRNQLYTFKDRLVVDKPVVALLASGIPTTAIHLPVFWVV